MRFKTTRDVLDHVANFHQQLHDLYGSLSETAEKERVKLLLDYMSKHEKHLNESLLKFEEEASEGIMETWFKYIPSSTVLKDCNEVSLKPDMSVEDIIKTAIKFAECLEEFYKIMAENSASERVKNVFSNLVNMERSEKLKLIKDAQQVYDL